MFPWVTKGADVEAYFCEAPYLAGLYGITAEEAERWRVDAAIKTGKAHETFLEKRKAIVRVLWPNGGSPDAEALWNEEGGKTPRTVKGKVLLKALKEIAKNSGKDDKLLNSYVIPAGFEMAPDLRAAIESAISAGSA